jgi:ribosomal protein S12 methylthiotransferase accessory factor
MTVGIVGSGPAAAAVAGALTDADRETTRIEPDGIGGTELAVVAGEAGDERFAEANEHALETGSRWIAVEVGGIGGIPVAEAAVSCFGPETACYECLSGRVSANLDRQSGESEVAAHTARFAGAVAGREALRYLADGDDIFGRVLTPPYDDRPVLPLPDCVCDSGTDAELDRSHVERELSDSLARAERALDGTVGIVQEVGEVESFPVPYYLARSCDTAGFSDASAAREAAGVDPDWNGAFMKALGEGLERYCAGVYRTAELETGAAAELADAVSPAEFVCKREPDPTDTIEWTRGEELRSGESVLLPAEFVYHPPPAHRYHAPVTTGLGLGNSGTEALLAGLYEVLERDAMMLAWYSTFEPLGLEIEDPVCETMENRAASEDLDVSLLLLTQDVDVPVVAAAVTREEWPKLAFGTGADLNVAGAARSALAEALQNWTELRGMGPDDAAEAMGAIGRYADEPGEAAAFVDSEATVPAESVGPETVPAGTDELDAVLDRLGETGLDAYAARTTTRDVEQIGFEAVRVVVPGSQPLTFGEHYFGERVETVPGELGFETRTDRAHHPFP